jgi:hypothetical protein
MITFRSTTHVRVLDGAEIVWTLDGERQDGQETVDIVNRHHAISLIQKG